VSILSLTFVEGALIEIHLAGRVGPRLEEHYGSLVGHAGVALDRVGLQQEDLRDD
jgi:hypothetical protein